MITIRKMADAHEPTSLSCRMRAKRFAVFERLTQALPRPLKIIDIGGTTSFWEHHGWADRPNVYIVTLNLAAEPKKYDNIESHVGDATNLKAYADKSFDIAFSNSVIEHLFTLENQAAMADEIRRVGWNYWVQTPNYWFPMEPHFQIPGWQWLPETLRVAMIRRWTCGMRGRTPDRVQARQLVREVRLLTYRELSILFPDAAIRPERFLGLVKSWIAIGGFVSL